MRKRLIAIIVTGKKRRSFVTVTMVLMMVLIASSFVACSVNQKGGTGEDTLINPEADQEKFVIGIVEDATMNTINLKADEDQMLTGLVEFSTMDADKTEVDGILIGKRLKIYYNGEKKGEALIRAVATKIEDVEVGYNPPKIDGLLQAINDSKITADGSIVITPEIKREFNQMGEDYRFFFMPKVDWYNFEAIAYEPTGEALAYILFTWTGEFGTFPEKAPKYEAEARLRKIFAAPNNEYPQLEHKAYKKCVMFDGEAYTPWPESYNDNTMVYNLTDLKVRQDDGYTYYHASSDEYQFDSTGAFEPGENEKFLNAQAEALGIDKTATLSKLLETGKIKSAPISRPFTIEFRIDSNNTTPKIVSVDKKI